jgi:hypothetical protein
MPSPELLPSTPPPERVVTRAFEDAGAVSPATARPLAEVVGADPAAVVPLVARRVIREAGPGRYYLHAGTEHARRRALVTAVLVFLLLLLPALLAQLAVRGAPAGGR